MYMCMTYVRKKSPENAPQYCLTMFMFWITSVCTLCPPQYRPAVSSNLSPEKSSPANKKLVER